VDIILSTRERDFKGQFPWAGFLNVQARVIPTSPARMFVAICLSTTVPFLSYPKIMFGYYFNKVLRMVFTKYGFGRVKLAEEKISFLKNSGS